MPSLENRLLDYAISGSAGGRLLGKTGVAISLLGARRLTRRMQALPVKVQKKVARAAVTKIARRMVKVVKESITTEDPPAVETGLLRKSIGYRMWTAPRGDWAVGATIGARKGWGTLVARNKRGKKKALTKKGIAKVVDAGGGFTRAQYSDPVKYAHLVEGGRRTGKHGTVEGRPFMEHSMLRSRDVMAGTLRMEIGRGIAREAAKLAKR